MYKKTSHNMQGRAERIVLKDMPSYADALTTEDQITAIRAALRKLDEQIVNTPKHKRYELGQRKHELAERMKELKSIFKKIDARTFEKCFVDVAKEVLTTGQFHLISNEARKRNESAATHPLLQNEVRV